MESEEESLSQQINRVDNSQTREALHRIANKIDKLEQRIDEVASSGPDGDTNLTDLSKTVKKIEKYLTFRDAAPFYGSVDSFLNWENSGWYGFVQKEDLKVQLEMDHILMLNARIRDSMLDYCLRAHMQVESIVRVVIIASLQREKNRFEQIWKRFVEGWSPDANYTPHNEPPTESELRKGGRKISHLTSAVFLLIYNGKPEWRLWEDPYDQSIDKSEQSVFYTLKNVRDIRNKAVHRTNHGINLEDLKEDKHLGDFFGENRMYKYDEVYKNLQSFMSEIESYRKKITGD